ncbi:MAG: hypothetical protein U0325_00245 [Polyangiales bacterium]
MTRLLSIAALALGCSATVAPVSTVDPDAAPPLATDAAPPLATDAAPPLATDAAPDTALPLATDAAMPLATDAATCLDDTAPRLEAGPDTAAGPALVVRAAGDRARNACADAWGMGGDARARFRAPRAGRWTFSAQGDQLWSFAARDLCARGSAERACTPYRDYHGGNPFSQPLVITVRLDAGEEVLLQADGCVGGCAWTLQATRQPDRGCFDPDRTCPMGARTTPEGGVDAASVCVPGRPPTLGAVQVLRGAGTLRVIGEASDADRDIARVRVIATDLRGGLSRARSRGGSTPPTPPTRPCRSRRPRHAPPT